MSFTLLHVNIEKSKHIAAVTALLENKKPDVICFIEAVLKDVEKIAKQFDYHFVFAPLYSFGDEKNPDQEGAVIFSKFPILDSKKIFYNMDIDGEIPFVNHQKSTSHNTQRPAERFLYNYTLLTALIEYEGRCLTISTTHFPVIDGHDDHTIPDLQNIYDLERTSLYRDKLVEGIRSVSGPLVFTADLNNPRGEYFYDVLAHELVDRVPLSLTSSLDPELHRVKDLHLMVDTFMTTPDILLESFEIIEGVSDHKAFFATINL